MDDAASREALITILKAVRLQSAKVSREEVTVGGTDPVMREVLAKDGLTVDDSPLPLQEALRWQWPRFLAPEIRPLVNLDSADCFQQLIARVEERAKHLLESLADDPEYRHALQRGLAHFSKECDALVRQRKCRLNYEALLVAAAIDQAANARADVANARMASALARMYELGSMLMEAVLLSYRDIIQAHLDNVAKGREGNKASAHTKTQDDRWLRAAFAYARIRETGKSQKEACDQVQERYPWCCESGDPQSVRRSIQRYLDGVAGESRRFRFDVDTASLHVGAEPKALQGALTKFLYWSTRVREATETLAAPRSREAGKARTPRAETGERTPKQR